MSSYTWATNNWELNTFMWHVLYYQRNSIAKKEKAKQAASRPSLFSLLPPIQSWGSPEQKQNTCCSFPSPVPTSPVEPTVHPLLASLLQLTYSIPSPTGPRASPTRAKSRLKADSHLFLRANFLSKAPPPAL